MLHFLRKDVCALTQCYGVCRVNHCWMGPMLSLTLCFLAKLIICVVYLPSGGNNVLNLVFDLGTVLYSGSRLRAHPIWSKHDGKQRTRQQCLS